MPDGPIFRSDDDIAEAIATRRESELAAYNEEDVKELGKWTI